MWPLSAGKGEIALATLVIGIRSISTFYEVPGTRSAVTMTLAQGVRSCKARLAMENSFFVAQPIQLIARAKCRG